MYSWAEIYERYEPSGLLTHRATVDQIQKHCCTGSVAFALPWEGAVARSTGKFDRVVAFGMRTKAGALAIELSRRGLVALSAAEMVWAMEEVPPFADLSLGAVVAIDPMDPGLHSMVAAQVERAAACLVVPDVFGWDVAGSVRTSVCTALKLNRPVFIMGRIPVEADA